MAKHTYQQANKRYMTLFTPAMIFYGLSIGGGIALVSATAPNNLIVRILAGLAAGVPLVIAIWALMRFVRETDEFNRQLNQQALAFAGGVTASVAVLTGFLQMYEVIPTFPTFWFGILYFITFGFGHILNPNKSVQCGPDEG